jgi:hypothetical protein
LTAGPSGFTGNHLFRGCSTGTSSNLGTINGNITINGTSGNYQYCLLDGNLTLNAVSLPSDSCTIQLRIKADGSARTVSINNGAISSAATSFTINGSAAALVTIVKTGVYVHAFWTTNIV